MRWINQNNNDLPEGSALPKTDEKLLSETKAFAAADDTEEPLKPICYENVWKKT